MRRDGKRAVELNQSKLQLKQQSDFQAINKKLRNICYQKIKITKLCQFFPLCSWSVYENTDICIIHLIKWRQRSCKMIGAKKERSTTYMIYCVTLWHTHTHTDAKERHKNVHQLMAFFSLLPHRQHFAIRIVRCLFNLNIFQPFLIYWAYFTHLSHLHE